MKKNTAKTLFTLIICFGFFGAANGSEAATYYVDPAGSDTNNGTSTATPWKTVAKVVNASLIGGDSVYFKSGGSWNEALYPKSGVSGNVVTYGAYGTGNKPVIRNFYADNKSYIKVQDLEFKSAGADNPLLIYNGSNHIGIYNCNIIADTASTSYVTIWLSKNVSYNEIADCVIKHNNITGNNDVINLRNNASYNIIRDNDISGGGHYGVALEGSYVAGGIANFNVIKNNTIHALGGGLSIAQDSNRNLIEGNTIIGGTNTGFNNGAVRSFKSVSQGNIIRRNVVRDNPDAAGSGISTEVYTSTGFSPNVATRNHTYNNLITGITGQSAGFGPIVIATNGSAGSAAYDNFWKNNIVAGNAAAYPLWIMNNATIHDNYFNNNILYRSGSTNILHLATMTTSVAGAQSGDPTHFSGNLQQDPLLDSSFKPQAGSPAIDAGDFLTTTTQAGNGTTLTVSDAGYFTDGFGITAGDTIQIGNNTATIKSIDYANNTITLTNSSSWNSGDKVSLPYSGSKPDIGAYEYQSQTPPPPTPVTYSITDFTNLVTDWLKTIASPADVNKDGTVNTKDLGIMMSSWK